MIFTQHNGTVYCVRLYFYQIVLSSLTFVWFEAIKMLKSNCFIGNCISTKFYFSFPIFLLLSMNKTKMSSNDWKQHIHWFENEQREEVEKRRRKKNENIR